MVRFSFKTAQARPSPINSERCFRCFTAFGARSSRSLLTVHTINEQQFQQDGASPHTLYGNLTVLCLNGLKGTLKEATLSDNSFHLIYWPADYLLVVIHMSRAARAISHAYPST